MLSASERVEKGRGAFPRIVRFGATWAARGRRHSWRDRRTTVVGRTQSRHDQMQARPPTSSVYCWQSRNAGSRPSVAVPRERCQRRGARRGSLASRMRGAVLPRACRRKRRRVPGIAAGQQVARRHDGSSLRNRTRETSERQDSKHNPPASHAGRLSRRVPSWRAAAGHGPSVELSPHTLGGWSARHPRNSGTTANSRQGNGHLEV